MNAGSILEQISKLTTSQRLLAAIAVYVVIFLVAQLVFLRGIKAEVSGQRAALTELTAQRTEYQSRADDRDRFEQEVQDLNTAFTQALLELPDSREIPDLLQRISTIGKKVGLEFLLFEPLDEEFRDFYAEVPVRIQVEGSYHEVATFFDRIGKLNRIVNIRDIEMGAPTITAGRVVLRTSSRAVTYRFLTEDEVGGQPTTVQR